VVIFLTVRGPIYLQTHSETYTHGNNVVLQKRPESYQSNVKNVILPKENQKNVLLTKLVTEPFSLNMVGQSTIRKPLFFRSL
jgi:hypothetical protein